MDRIFLIKEYVDSIIDNKVPARDRKDAYVHTYGVAGLCFIFAGRRGLNIELAYIIGLLHDVYAYYTGSYLCHGQSGADMVRVAIRKMNIFTNDEKMLIASAIFHHSDKGNIHGEYDEVLKDADVLQPFLNNSGFRVHYLAAPRLNRILTELNINATPVVFGKEQLQASDISFNRSVFTDIAEELASKKISGDKDSDIYKYYQVLP